MSYCLPADVRLVLSPDGTSDPSNASAVDDTGLQPACDDATAEVNARLAVRYSVPFNPVPEVVVKLTTDIAAYLATLLVYGGMEIAATHPVALRYARAQKLLEALSAGKATLDVADDAQPVGQTVVYNPTDGPLWEAKDFALERGPRDRTFNPNRWPWWWY